LGGAREDIISSTDARTLERAKRLLDEGGYRDEDGDGLIEDEGRNLKLTLLVQSDWNRVAELIEDYFGSIGIALVTRSVDFNTWMAEKDKYAYDLTITRTTPWGMLMHANWATGYFDSRRSGQGVLHVLDDPAFLRLSVSFSAMLSVRRAYLPAKFIAASSVISTALRNWDF